MWYVIIITPRQGNVYHVHGPYPHKKVWREAALCIQAAKDEGIFVETAYISQEVDPDRLMKELL